MVTEIHTPLPLKKTRFWHVAECQLAPSVLNMAERVRAPTCAAADLDALSAVKPRPVAGKNVSTCPPRRGWGSELAIAPVANTNHRYLISTSCRT